MWGNKSYYVFNACSYTHMDGNPISFVQRNADCDVNPNGGWTAPPAWPAW